jgi:hypothetical protein
MRSAAALLILLMTWTSYFAQDGSDITYFKPGAVDSTFIGQDVHFDFFNRSFGGRTLDKIDITIDTEPVTFTEVRTDNGYNNWFGRQGLQAIDKVEGLNLKISKFRLDSITAASFKVTLFLEFYDHKNKLLPGKSRQIEYWFDKKDIFEVLVRSKQR